MSDALKKLPVGLADFQEIRDGDYVYADKTELLYNLLKLKLPYFLSRPRRFGKTLLVDTLKHILLGHRELFKGLWIDKSDYPWTPYPVIHLSMNSISTKSVETVDSDLIESLIKIARRESLSLRGSTPTSVFSSLFSKLNAKYDRKVAVLIDEYDYPIVEQLENPELATEIRKTLRSFYNVLKGVESFRGFTFITGVTEFGQNSIFAFLNNLNDLTFDPEYSTVCGFTFHEFDSLFLGHMETMLECSKSDETLPRGATVADLRGLILDWYDGYSWDGETRVLNPWSILNVLDNKNFSDYWVQSGCFPSFLAQSLRSERSKFNLFKAKKTLNRRFNPFGLDKDLDPFSILFQSGYLTFDRVEFKYGDELYFLKIPNLEVKSCFVPVVFSLNPPTRVMSAKKQAEAMVSSLFNLDVTGFQDSFGKFIGFFYPDYREVDAPYFRRLFEAAMVFADRDFQKKAPLGQGRYAYILKAPDETRFAIDINHSRLTEKEREKGLNPHSKIKKMANDSIKRMGPKKIDPIFKVPGRDFHKVAVVVNEKAEVFCLIQKEEFS